ncbi:MAG: hypothetical protein RBU45_22320 [Myxococcota bacterium]|nr:hypothetical protein [Myxococcota bacterium]
MTRPRPFEEGLASGDLRRLLHDAIAGKVVSLGRVRRLERWLSEAGTPDILLQLEISQAVICEMIYLARGKELLRWIACLCREQRVGTRTTPEKMACWLRERPHYQRENQRIRCCFAEFNAVRSVSVAAHVRDGKRICEHRRYLGCEHLQGLPVEQWPPIVGEVVRALVNGTVAARGEA